MKLPRLTPFYSYYTGQPALASSPSYELEVLLEKSFTACMPLLMAR